MFRQRPSLAAELLTNLFDLEVPAWNHVRLDSCDLPELKPTEYRADTAITLLCGQEAALAVIVEIQNKRDLDKRRTWPVYLTNLHARLRCPTVLIVISTAGNAKWCATPINIGHPGWVLRPLVLGPDRVPLITNVSDAIANRELSLLSVLVHGESPERDKVFDSFLRSLDTVDQKQVDSYLDLILAELPKTAQRLVEKLMMTYEYRSDFARRHFARGRAEGLADARRESVLTVLATRGIEITPEARERITSCTDLDRLQTWVERAVKAHTPEDLFD